MPSASPPTRILHVEDDEGALGLVRRILSPREFEVIEVTTGLEALRRAPEERPDLILLDLDLPDIDGYSVATRLRGVPELAGIPVIAITGHGDRERALSLGCDGFVEKPYDVDSFAATLREYLAGKRERAAEAREPQLARQVQSLVDDLERRIEELSAANARLHELDRLRREFIQNITHELTTPLTPAVGYARILRDEKAGPLTPLQRKCVDAMDLSLRRLQLLIDDLLDITRIEAGQFALVLSDVVPGDAVDEALDLVAALAEAKSISVERVLGAPGPIRADAGKVVQALVHLLRNAVKFTPDGGKVLVEARARPNGWVEFLVYDSGIGIPGDQLETIFAPFFQVDGSTTRRFGGVGIGLTLVQRVVEAHGGRAWAESPPARQPPGRFYRGSRVGFALPPQPPPDARTAGHEQEDPA